MDNLNFKLLAIDSKGENDCACLDLCNEDDEGHGYFAQFYHFGVAEKIVTLWNLNEEYDLSKVGEVVSILECFEKSVDLWLPKSANESHAGEAQALHALRDKMLHSLKNIKREKA